MFNTLFSFNNSIQFDFYIHFLVLYLLFFAAAIGLRIYRKNTTKKLRMLKATLKNLSNNCLQYSFLGFFLLFSRYAQIYFLSMPFLHLLNFFTLVSFAGYNLYQFKQANKLN